jgi:hypothetical protein
MAKNKQQQPALVKTIGPATDQLDPLELAQLQAAVARHELAAERAALANGVVRSLITQAMQRRGIAPGVRASVDPETGKITVAAPEAAP